MSWLVSIAPSSPIDPWNLLSPKKIATMILALLVIQILGTAMVRYLGARAGAVLSGFCGGLISSTATTAALAKRSQRYPAAGVSAEVLTFLAATAAMLLEAFALLLLGTTQFHGALSIVFLGPLLTTVLLTYRHSNMLGDPGPMGESHPFQILPIVKLAGFIVAVLALSKILQKLFGQTGLMILTFLVSLFEIHGSVIANVQLHDSGGVGVLLLGGLLAISIFASYLSKLFLVFSIGSRALRTEASKSTLLLLLSLLASWLIFALFTTFHIVP